MRQKADGIFPVRDHIESFIHRAERIIDLQAVIVFGSRATGGHLHASDLDILVVSASFEGMAPFRRSELLLDSWTGETTLEPLGFTPAEFTGNDSLLIFDVLEFGVPVLDRGIFSRARERFIKRKESGEVQLVQGGWKIRLQGQERQCPLGQPGLC